MNGFTTDTDLPGGEKLVLASVEDKWLTSKRVIVASAECGADSSLLPPQHVFTVKGFNRSVSALLVLLACSEYPPLMEAGYHWSYIFLDITVHYDVSARRCQSQWSSMGLSIN